MTTTKEREGERERVEETNGGKQATGKRVDGLQRARPGRRQERKNLRASPAAAFSLESSPSRLIPSALSFSLSLFWFFFFDSINSEKRVCERITRISRGPFSRSLPRLVACLIAEFSGPSNSKQQAGTAAQICIQQPAASIQIPIQPSNQASQPATHRLGAAPTEEEKEEGDNGGGQHDG
jgi:hypothetical protein